MDVVEEAKRVKRKFIKLENEEKEKLKRIEEWKETVEKERRKIEIEKRKQEILGKLMDDKRVTAYLTKKLKELSKRVKELSKEYIETNERLKEIREKSRKEQLRTRQKLIKKLNKEIKDFRERLYNLRGLENIKKEHIRSIDMKIQALQEYPKEGKNSRIYKKRTGKDIKEEVEANCNIDQEIKELERINARILRAKNDLKILNESKGMIKEKIEEERLKVAMGKKKDNEALKELEKVEKAIKMVKDTIGELEKDKEEVYEIKKKRLGCKQALINDLMNRRDEIEDERLKIMKKIREFNRELSKRKKAKRKIKTYLTIPR